jgi:hypothetical protein
LQCAILYMELRWSLGISSLDSYLAERYLTAVLHTTLLDRSINASWYELIRIFERTKVQGALIIRFICQQLEFQTVQSKLSVPWTRALLGISYVTSSDDPGLLHVSASNVLDQSPNSYFPLQSMPIIYIVGPAVLLLIASIPQWNKGTVRIPCSQSEWLNPF